MCVCVGNAAAMLFLSGLADLMEFSTVTNNNNHHQCVYKIAGKHLCWYLCFRYCATQSVRAIERERKMRLLFLFVTKARARECFSQKYNKLRVKISMRHIFSVNESGAHAIAPRPLTYVCT